MKKTCFSRFLVGVSGKENSHYSLFKIFVSEVVCRMLRQCGCVFTKGFAFKHFSYVLLYTKYLKCYPLLSPFYNLLRQLRKRVYMYTYYIADKNARDSVLKQKQNQIMLELNLTNKNQLKNKMQRIKNASIRIKNASFFNALES